MAFSEQLKKLLDKNGLKAVDLARATGLSEAAISDYLKGKKEPRGKQSIAIAKALTVSLDTLWQTGFDTSSNLQTHSNIEILNKYNSLNDDFKKIVENLVDQFLQIQENGEQ